VRGDNTGIDCAFKTSPSFLESEATNIVLEGEAIDGDFFFNPVLSYQPLPGSLTIAAFAGNLASPTYVISQLKLSV
jgi:hypothetical protein